MKRAKSAGFLLTMGLFFLLPLNGCDDLFDPDNGDDALVQAWLPLAEGAEWRYVEVESGREDEPYVYTVTVVGAETRNGRSYFQLAESDSERYDLYRVEGGVGYMWPRDMPFEIPVFDMDLAVGSSREISAVYVEADDTMRMSGQLAYVRNETVTTPAGTFNNARVFEMAGSFTQSSKPSVVMEGGLTSWFARGVGRVKEVNTFSDGETGQTGTSTVTLHYYSIPGGLSGGHDGTYTVSGRVMQHEGSPVAGVTVNLSQARPDDPTAVTNEQGEYVFEGVKPGAYTVAVLEKPADFRRGDGIQVNVVDRDLQLADLIMVRYQDPGGFSIRGWTKTPEDFAIAEANMVMTRRGAEWVEWENQVDMIGDWRFDGMPPGTYVIRPIAEHFSFEPDSVVITLTDDSVDDVLFTGTGGATVTGKLVTPLGIGMGGLEMTLGSPFNPAAPSQAAISDSAGVYSFINVPAGPATVNGYDSHYLFDLDPYGLNFQVEGTSTTIPDITVEPNPLAWHHTVSGTVRNARNQAPADDYAVVTLYSTLFGLERSAVIGFDGSYTIPGVFDGAFVLRATSSIYPPMSPDSIVGTVSGGNVTGMDFSFTGFNVTGRIVDERGNPVAGATVRLDTPPEQVLGQQITGSDGRFSFSDLAAGAYSITPEKEGLMFWIQHININGNHDEGDIVGTHFVGGGGFQP